jgi:hypothetical protein
MKPRLLVGVVLVLMPAHGPMPAAQGPGAMAIDFLN